MGRRGRAKGHRGRGRARETAPTASVLAPEVHVTVATVPKADIAESLEHDAALVKAALLYADHVTLASPNALMMAGVAGLTVPDSQDRRDALMGVLSGLPEGAAASEVYEDLRRRRHRLTPRERLLLRQIESTLKDSGDEVASTVEGMLEQAGMPELQAAMTAGVLGIHLLGLEDAKPDEFSDKVIDGLTAVLTAAVSGTVRTFPMFDDGTGDLVSSMIADGLITDARATRSNEIGAAGRLIGQLEAFPNAGMDVVLDVREQLTKPLVRFRAALARASGEIESPAWKTEELAREVEDLYRREVAPALADLEEAMHELGARATLRRVASDAEMVKASAAIAISASAGVGLAHLPHVVFGGGALVAGIATTAREADRRSEVRRRRESNEFYFLYEANRRLRR